MYWSTKYSDGAWVIDDYSTSKWALTNSHFSAHRASRWLTTAESAQAQKTLRPFKVLLSESVVFLEGDRHKALRKILVESLRTAMNGDFEDRLRLMVANVIHAALEKQAVDVVKEVAQLIPTISIFDLLGINPANKEEFLAWCKDISGFLSDPIEQYGSAVRARDAVLSMADFFNEMIQIDDLSRDNNKILFNLLSNQAFMGVRARRVLLAQLCTLLFGAYETTQNLIASAFWLLSEFPGEFIKIKNNPFLIDGAIEEMLRFISPVQYTGRVIIKDTVINGFNVKRNQLIIIDIAKANRDPLVYSSPDRFDVGRSESRHLAFGHGHHFCLGSRLSTLELKIVLQNLLANTINIRALAGPIPLPRSLYRGFDYLPMEMVRS